MIHGPEPLCFYQDDTRFGTPVFLKTGGSRVSEYTGTSSFHGPVVPSDCEFRLVFLPPSIPKRLLHCGLTLHFISKDECLKLVECYWQSIIGLREQT